jgi:hypothetical protein
VFTSYFNFKQSSSTRQREVSGVPRSDFSISSDVMPCDFSYCRMSRLIRSMGWVM